MSSEVTPVSLTDYRQSLNLTTCMFETARPEVDHAYLSDILKNSRQVCGVSSDEVMHDR